MSQSGLNLFVVLAGLLVLVFVENGVSLKCYKCNTMKNDTDCEQNVPCTSKAEFPSCMKTVEVHPNGKSYILKDCMALREKEADKCEVHTIEEEKTICTCSTDFCNEANDKITNNLILSVLTFLTTLVHLF